MADLTAQHGSDSSSGLASVAADLTSQQRRERSQKGLAALIAEVNENPPAPVFPLDGDAPSKSTAGSEPSTPADEQTDTTTKAPSKAETTPRPPKRAAAKKTPTTSTPTKQAATETDSRDNSQTTKGSGAVTAQGADLADMPAAIEAMRAHRLPGVRRGTGAEITVEVQGAMKVAAMLMSVREGDLLDYAVRRLLADLTDAGVIPKDLPQPGSAVS